MKNEIVITNNKLSKTEEQAILETGIGSLEDFFDNFQYLCFVLDGSGSMSSPMMNGETPKFQLQKKVVLKYADDKIGVKAIGMKIGIVEFSDRAEVRLDGCSDLSTIRAAIARIYNIGGGTHAARGLKSAMAMLRKGRKGSEELIPRIILTSDGAVHDLYDCYECAEAAKKSEIVIDTIYIGEPDDLTHNEQLRRISEITGGVHEMITNEAEFEQKFLKVAARQITAGSMVF